MLLLLCLSPAFSTLKIWVGSNRANHSVIENHSCCLNPKCIPVRVISVQKDIKFRRFKNLLKSINFHRNTLKVISPKSPVTPRAFEKRKVSCLSLVQSFLMFGSEVTELGYLTNQVILNLKGSNLSKALVLLSSLLCRRLAISISLKSSFNRRCNSVIELKPNLAKLLKKFNSLFRYVTVRASNVLMQE